MDVIFCCPDCGLEHDEPFEASLGHLARCLDCTVAAEAADDIVLSEITFEIAA